jgi:surface antigen
MRLTAFFAGIAVFAAFLAANSSQVSAEIDKKNDLKAVSTEVVDVLDNKVSINQISSEPQSQPPAVKPIEHTVVKGDTLIKIAKTYSTTWQRVFNKNLTITNPSLISPGEKIIIPDPNEVLTERNNLIANPKPAATKPPTKLSPNSTPKVSVKKSSSAGNTYFKGYCTWYAKQRRPDLPNGLGNASTWVTRARAMGLATGSEPRVGAIGQRGNHVVYVESVNGDGTVTISEMNWKGRGVISTRTIPANSHTYIY